MLRGGAPAVRGGRDRRRNVAMIAGNAHDGW
jgi:hypothetical protein